MNIHRPASFTVFVVIAMGSYLLLSSLPFTKQNSEYGRKLNIQPCEHRKIEKPDHPIELSRIVAMARQSQRQISIVEAGDSHPLTHCKAEVISVDMRGMNQLIDLDLGKQEVTVQVGMTWQGLQERLDIFGLSLSVIPRCTYCTIGSAISTNAYGQAVGSNLTADLISSLRVLLSDEQHLFTSEDDNSELFQAVIGSQNLIGIITEATLKVVPNTMLIKQEKAISLANYSTYFTEISKDPNLALHSSLLTLGPPNRNKITVTNYWDTHQPAPPKQERNSAPPGAAYLQRLKESWASRHPETISVDAVSGLNEELSRSQLVALSNNILTGSDDGVSGKNLLQEYFIPANQLQAFFEQLQQWHKRHLSYNNMSASMHWVNGDKISLTPYAPTPCFAVTLFTDKWKTIEQSTLAKLNDKVLPEQAYPDRSKLIAAKKKWDPANLLSD